jgi:hypothetical protein
MPNAPRRPRAGATEDTAVTEPAAAGVRPDPVLTQAWVVALLIATIGAIVGMLFLHYRNPPGTGPAAGFGVVAAVFVLAAAIERVLEGLNHVRPLGGDTRANPALRTSRAAVMLGLAAALAMSACGYFGLGMLHAFTDNGSPRYVDVIVTGLGIGAATKPLHDLIRGIERWSHRPAGERP